MPSRSGIGAGPSTAFLLLGKPSAAPVDWRVRRLRIDGVSREAAARTTARRDAQVRVMVGLIVTGMESLGDERDSRERRLRVALHRLRASVAAALSRSGRLGKETPPLLVDVQWSPELLARGRVARALEEGLRASIEDGGGEEEEEDENDDDAEERMNPASAPEMAIIAKSYKPKGRRRWAGVAVVRPNGTALPPSSARSEGRRLSKALSAVLKLKKEGRKLVYLAPTKANDPAGRPLPDCTNPVTCPLGLVALDNHEIGVVVRIDCDEATSASEPGALVVTGAVDERGKKSALMARTFVRLYQGWLETFFGRPFAKDPATARVLLHVYNGDCTKEGPSLGPAFAVGLAAYFLDLDVRDWLAVTGDITLSGDLGPVGGLREKLLGAFEYQLEQPQSGSRLTVVLPSENVVGGVVGETPHFLDGGMAEKIQLPKALRDGLDVQEAAHMFAVLALALLPPQERKLPALVRPPRPSQNLSIARCIYATERGGMVLLMECALLQPGSGAVVHAAGAMAGLVDSVELGLTWLEKMWEEDIVAHYPTGILHRPADKLYDLHFNYPICLAPDVVVMAEVRLDGGLIAMPDYSAVPTVTLDVAKANKISRVFTTPGRAAALNAVKMRNRQRYHGIEVQAIGDMVDLIKALW